MKPYVLQLVHLFATVAWIGGMIFMKAVLMPALSALEAPARGRLMGAIAKRFTLLAWTSVALLLVTGLMKTPSGMLAETTTGVGRLLFAKHALFALMIVIGFVITFAVAPKIGKLAPAPGAAPGPEFVKAQRALDGLSAVNALLGFAVLAIAAAF
ncbi:hypothetical protein FBQ97_11950 [Acidobacteria bacterium ACD]|nr:MAG: hypothetical protein EDX89_00800 [Acidobacteriota bacterium]MCE7960442.1 hypothetical protein [Acidobacteria bacterium ACB2]MDL1950511.1 hypothetical protein [Acidobacteria bacterium ACD]